jgi:hypothetical protein
VGKLPARRPLLQPHTRRGQSGRDDQTSAARSTAADVCPRRGP